MSAGQTSVFVSTCLQDLGVFIPAPMSQGMRMDFFLESPFMPHRLKLDRETLGGLADMFGQMPGASRPFHVCLLPPRRVRVPNASLLYVGRQWDRNGTGRHSGQVLAHHGTPSYQPALQRSRRSHRSSTAVPVRHGAQVVCQVQPGKPVFTALLGRGA